MKKIRLKQDYFARDTWLYTVLAISVFLPYFAAAAVQAVTVGIVLCKKDAWKKIFSYRCSKFIIPFAITGLAVPVFYRNWLGLAVNAAVVLFLLFLQYLRAVATRKAFDKALDVACVMSLVAVAYGAVEFILLRTGVMTGRYLVRCSSFFYNPNFFGTVMAMMIVVSAYKILSRGGFNLLHYITMVACFGGIELSGSIFALVEVAVGMFLLLYFAKKYKVLCLFLTVFIFAVFSVILIPELIPRFDEISKTIEIRLNIWRIVLAIIKDHPVLGVGALPYHHLSATYAYVLGGAEVWKAYYAHNIVLELVAGNGILGTAFFFSYFVSMFRDFLRLRPRGRSRNLAALPVAVLGGALVHGLVDITIMWIQPAMLILILLSAFGALEKMPQIYLSKAQIREQARKKQAEKSGEAN